MTGLVARLAWRWRKNRIGPWFHKDWRFGWLGNGWNMLQLGYVTFSFRSGPSPFARLKRRVGFCASRRARFMTPPLPSLSKRAGGFWKRARPQDSRDARRWSGLRWDCGCQLLASRGERVYRECDRHREDAAILEHAERHYGPKFVALIADLLENEPEKMFTRSVRQSLLREIAGENASSSDAGGTLSSAPDHKEHAA